MRGFAIAASLAARRSSAAPAFAQSRRPAKPASRRRPARRPPPAPPRSGTAARSRRRRSRPGAKIAFVNLQASRRIRSKARPRRAACNALIQKKQTEGADKAKQLQANQQKLQTERQRHERSGARRSSRRKSSGRQKEGERFQQDAQAEINELQQELQHDFQKKLSAARRSSSRQEKGLQLLFSAPDAGIVLGGSGHRPDERRDQEARRGTAAKPARGTPQAVAAPSRLAMARWLIMVEQSDRHSALGNQPLAVASRDQHPHPPRPALLPVSVAARRRDHRARRRAGGSSPSRTSRSTRSSSRGIFPGAPLMPAVLMLESLSQVAAILLLRARRRAAQRARLPARRQRRQVPPPGRAGRSAAARGLARAPPRVAGARAGGGLSSAIRSSPKPSCCSALVRRPRREIDPTAIVASARADRRRHHRSARTRSIGPHVTHRRATAGSARRRSSTAGPRSATTREIYPFASIGLIPQDLKFQRRGDAADRSAGATSSASSSPSTAARAAAAA